MAKKEENTDIKEATQTREECFIVTPIGVVGSETYVKAMGLIDAVIQPVLDEFNILARPANRMEDLGSINKQLIKRVLEDKLVIANLTGLNPNVMYELAVRHAVRKPVIIMAEEGTRLPFDISDQRTIFYSDTLAGVELAKQELKKKINFALQDEKPDNPIYSALQSEQIFQQLDPANPLSVILERLDKMESKISQSDRTSSLKNLSAKLRSNSEGFVINVTYKFDDHTYHSIDRDEFGNFVTSFGIINVVEIAFNDRTASIFMAIETRNPGDYNSFVRLFKEKYNFVTAVNHKTN